MNMGREGEKNASHDAAVNITKVNHTGSTRSMLSLEDYTDHTNTNIALGTQLWSKVSANRTRNTDAQLRHESTEQKQNLQAD